MRQKLATRASRRPAAVLLIVATALVAIAPHLAEAQAQSSVVLDMSPGTGSPPPTLGPSGEFTMSRLAAGDVQPSPALSGEPTAIDGYSTYWDESRNPYSGDVWVMNGGQNQEPGVTEVFTLPANTVAFYLYGVPITVGTDFEAFATASDQSTVSGAIPMGTPASYFGFYVNDCASLTSIAVTASVDSRDYPGVNAQAAFGEFGIATRTGGSCTGGGGTPTPTPTPYLPPNVPPSVLGQYGLGTGSGDASVDYKPCSSGSPVVCSSGDFWHTFTDVAVTGRGPALDLTRTYNSDRAADEGIFGYGWSSSYDMRLTIQSDGVVGITEEDGSEVFAIPEQPHSDYRIAGFADSTLTHNPDGTWSFARHQQDTYVFSAGGRLLSVTDRNGYRTSLTYDSAGHLATVTDPAGRSLTVTTGSNGLVSSVADPMGRTTRYGYDGAGDLTSVTDPMGRRWGFSYDPSHLLLTMTDPMGGVTTNRYDSSARVTSQSDPMGRVTGFQYAGDSFSAAGGSTTITDPSGAVEVQDYVNGTLTGLTKGVGSATPATWSYGYDPNSLGTTTSTDPDGHTTTSTYDRRGNLLSRTDPLNRTTTWTYNAFDEPLTVTDPTGDTTTSTYDSRGNLLSVSVADGSAALTTTFTYGDPADPGDVTAMTDPDGHTWDYGYDRQGDLVSTTDPDGNVTTASYDLDSEKVSQTSPRGKVAGGSPGAFTTTYSYDEDGELTATTDPLGHLTADAYDQDGRLVAVTDPEGNTTRYSYDSDSELLSTTAADGSVTSETYDAMGNEVTSTDANGKVTRYAYDTLNRVISATDPLGQVTTYAYDADGNLTATTDARGVTTTHTYDAGSELAGTSYSDGTPSVSYRYDADGRRVSMTDGTGTTSSRYDPAGRLLSVTDGSGATVSYGYDPDGNLTTLGYPDGRQVTYSYDAAGHMTSVSDGSGNTVSFGYDPDSNLTAQDFPGGVTETRSYDPAGQLTGITDQRGAQTLASFGYQRNPDGLLTSTTTSGVAQPQPTESYGYTQYR